MAKTVTLAHSSDAVHAPPSRWRQALEDLQPVPGRAGLTWRIALLCALVTGTAMMFEIPEAAISCYLVIFLMKPDAIVNIGTGIGFLVLLPGLIALLVWIINLTQGSTLHIMLAIVITSCLLLYLGAATQLGEQGNVAALIIAFVLTLIVQAPFGDAATLALREVWTMAALPMIWMVGFNLLLGFSPVALLRDKLRVRLAAAAEALETGEPARLRELLREGNAPFEPQALAARLLRLVPSAAARQVAADVRAGFALMFAVSALPAALDPARRAALANHIHTTHAALGAGETPPLPPTGAQGPPAHAGPAESAAWAALGVLAGAPEPEVVPAPTTPFIAADALSNPAYTRFAFKTTAAAVICFLIYTAIDWQGIHTAMITCYVAALATTGETVHKLALRITGCLIGAALGVASIFWIIPQIDGVGALMALVFFGCLVGAWVSTGPERIAYAGVQIALAFLLTVVQGFGPSVNLDTAQGRIVGILLGNLVVYLIFTRVWPAPVEGQVRKLFARALAALAQIARLAPASRGHAVSSAAAVESLAGQCEEALRLLPYEPRGMRPPPAREAALHAAVTEIEALNRAIWLSRDEDLGQTAERLDVLAEQFLGPAGDNPSRDASAGPSGSLAQHRSPAPITEPFTRQLEQLQEAAG